MSGFRVLPLPATLSQTVRNTLKSPQYGHPAHVELAGGTGPCRVCLRQFRVRQENRILFTYNPFEGLDLYPSPGPVFIHADVCAEFAELDKLPEELRSLPLTLEAYGENRWIIARERPASHEIERSVQRLLQTPDVRYIHIRHTEAGCFIARVEPTLAE